MKNKILLIFIIVSVVGAGIGFYLYNKPHESVADEAPAFTLPAEQLANEYNTDERKANAKYLGKIIEVSGTIAEKLADEKGKINVTLEGADIAGVGCEFEKSQQKELNKLNEGDKVTIKGICTGVLMDVVIVDCVITQPQLTTK